MSCLLSACHTEASCFQPLLVPPAASPPCCPPTRPLCFPLLTVNGDNNHQEWLFYYCTATCSTTPVRSFLHNTLNPRETREQSNDQIIISIIHFRVHIVKVQKAELWQWKSPCSYSVFLLEKKTTTLFHPTIFPCDFRAFRTFKTWTAEKCKGFLISLHLPFQLIGISCLNHGSDKSSPSHLWLRYAAKNKDIKHMMVVKKQRLQIF